MKELLTSPGFLSPYGTWGADVSSIMAWVFTLLFIYGWHVGKKHQGQRHHLVTLWGMLAMLLYFTLYYLARGLGALSVEGKEGFGGPQWVYDYVFGPILTVHITAVSLGLVLAVYMLILGFRASFKKNGGRYLKSASLYMEAKNFRKILISAGVGLGIVAIIRWGSIQRLMVYLSGFLIVAAVLLLERGLERWMPDGAVRHRKIGAVTMTLYVVALFTSTISYVLLYYIYPVKP